MSAPAKPAWPDPERPGVPLHPERDGWHWVVAANPSVSTESAPWLWESANEHWLPPVDVSGAAALKPDCVHWAYLGPCLTQEDLARVAEALRAVRKRIESEDWVGTCGSCRESVLRTGQCGCLVEHDEYLRKIDAALELIEPGAPKGGEA